MMFHPALLGLMAATGGAAVGDVPSPREGVGPWSPRRGFSAYGRRPDVPTTTPEGEERLEAARLKRERRAAKLKEKG